jgi:hypothetical protein
LSSTSNCPTLTRHLSSLKGAGAEPAVGDGDDDDQDDAEPEPVLAEWSLLRAAAYSEVGLGPSL